MCDLIGVVIGDVTGDVIGDDVAGCRRHAPSAIDEISQSRPTYKWSRSRWRKLSLLLIACMISLVGIKPLQYCEWAGDPNLIGVWYSRSEGITRRLASSGV